MRRAQPYVAISGPGGTGHRAAVGSAPTLATRSKYGVGYSVGLETRGRASARVPIEHPYAGQGAVWPAFPYFTGSSVAPDLRGTNLLVALNDFSPITHADARFRFSMKIPEMMAAPSVLRRPPQTQRGRPSGRYVIEHPMPNAWWPTSQQWLAERVRLGQQPPSGWQGHGGRP